MKVEIEVGKTVHNQSLKLVAARAQPGDPWLFGLFKEAVSQRDEPDAIRGLSMEVLEAIGKAVATVKGIDG